jgi:outer membrane protein TolC
LKNITVSTIKSLAAITLTGAFLSSCGFQTYKPQPIDPAQSIARYQAHDPDSEAFSQYLIAQGYSENSLPIKQWGVQELVLSALYFHPELDVARAQWHAAQAAEITSGESRNPGISSILENHSETAGGISPWTYGLSIDIPIETGGKRQARIDRARSLSAAARIDIAQAAWKVRSRVIASLIDYNASRAQGQLLQKELDLRSQIVAMLKARLNVGMVSNTEISTARLQLQNAQQTLATEKGRELELRAILASNAGLPIEVFNKIDLAAPPSITQESPLSSNELQQSALLNRLDIRAALARYDAAEARLRLEIARQYPDIVLSPGYSFDQGDRIWSLGLSTLLSLLNKNEGLIAEAQALRETEAAQFNALQVQIINDLEQATAAYAAAIEQLQKFRQIETSHLNRLQQTQHQFDAGLADRLELTAAELETVTARHHMLIAIYKVKRAKITLENAMQRPLNNEFTMPVDISKARP